MVVISVGIQTRDLVQLNRLYVQEASWAQHIQEPQVSSILAKYSMFFSHHSLLMACIYMPSAVSRDWDTAVKVMVPYLYSWILLVTVFIICIYYVWLHPEKNY